MTSVSKIPEHRVWEGMKERCYYPKHKGWFNYGGRGIKICERWLGVNGFWNFYADMGPRPTPKHQIDRRDNDGNYEPGNCKWTTQTEQSVNKRVYRNNTSGFKGVYWRKQCGHWVANISVGGKRTMLGCFDEFEQAKKARLEAERALWKF